MAIFIPKFLLNQTVASPISTYFTVDYDTTFVATGLTGAEIIALQTLITDDTSENSLNNNNSWQNSIYNNQSLQFSTAQNALLVIGRGYYRFFTSNALSNPIKIVYSERLGT